MRAALGAIRGNMLSGGHRCRFWENAIILEPHIMHKRVGTAEALASTHDIWSKRSNVNQADSNTVVTADYSRSAVADRPVISNRISQPRVLAAPFQKALPEPSSVSTRTERISSVTRALLQATREP